MQEGNVQLPRPLSRPARARRAVLTAVLVLVATMLQLPAASPAAALTLPSGFQLVDYPTGQAPYNLTNFAWIGDGGLLTTGKDGTITFVPAGGAPRQLTKIPDVRAVGDHGLLGLALANDYATTGRVYLAYDKGAPSATGHGMVEEWQASPADDPTSFTRVRAVIDGRTTTPQLAQATRFHGIDSVVVAPDDTLFISIGDDSANNGDPRTLRAQDLTQPYGKILRVDSAGKGVLKNPFYSAAAPSSWRSRVYAYGFRNPFRFSLDPRSGIPHVGDVGWNAQEEIDTLKPGVNAGWPCYEGRTKTSFSTYAVCKNLYAAGSAHMPIWTYPHAGKGSSVVAGFHYTGTTYPQQYRGSFFLGDYSRGSIWTMATDTAGRMTRAPEAGGFATAAGGPVAFQPGPNGDVTYADLLSGKVRRLVFSDGNRAPVARFTSTTNPTTRDVSFSAADSYDLDGDQLSYQWDFGDGSTAQGAAVDHRYADDAAVQVTLTVRDQLGAQGTTSMTVHPANHTPTLTVDAPGGRTYAVGENVHLSGTAHDTEDGPLTISWDTALLHCPFAGSCHLHPDGTRTGADYDEAFTDHGSDTTMVVTARVTDSKGAVATSTYTAEPRLRTLTVQSPVPVNVNGLPAAAAAVVAGSDVELDAPLSSSSWQFTGWSNGKPATHSLTMPDSDLTLTASYVSAIDVKFRDLGGASGVLGSATTAEYDVAGGRARNYTGGRIYWSAGTGAHEIHGPILAKFLAAGGTPALGFPTSDVVPVPGGSSSSFTKGGVYWSSTTGARVLKGPLLAKYLAVGGPGAYGFPTTDHKTVRGGYYAHFTGGRSIFGSPRHGAHLVYGKIRSRYAARGYQRSCLGFPTTDEFAIVGGRRNRFVGGRITYWYRTRTAVARC
jgi:glucose/arabinose dehydrogenase